MGKKQLRLYHFTTKRSKDHMKFFAEKKGNSVLRDWGNLNPKINHPQIVYEKWRDFFNNANTNWYCTQNRISAMDNIKIWNESGELSRLIHFIGERVAYDKTPELLAFDINPKDFIWVCEADWLRKYHEGRFDRFESHIKFAESRIELCKYDGQYRLPEFMVGNPVAFDRIIWLPFPMNINTDIKLTTFAPNPGQQNPQNSNYI